jgi:hypothetical protein
MVEDHEESAEGRTPDFSIRELVCVVAPLAYVTAQTSYLHVSKI